MMVNSQLRPLAEEILAQLGAYSFMETGPIAEAKILEIRKQFENLQTLQRSIEAEQHIRALATLVPEYYATQNSNNQKEIQ
jgi:hypothetical protein